MDAETIALLFDCGGKRCHHANIDGWTCERERGHPGFHMVRPGRYEASHISFDMWYDDGTPYPPGPYNERVHKIKVEQPKGEDDDG